MGKGIRWIIHYLNGRTLTSDWGNEISFPEKWSNAISSMQLQKKDGKLYTLSAKRKQFGTFWQRDGEKSRSILRKLHKDIWEELTLYQDQEKPKLKIIKEKIEVGHGNRK